MANCKVCNEKLGGLTGLRPVEKTYLDSAKNDGMSIPDAICYSCYHKLRNEFFLEKNGPTPPTPLEENERKIADLLSSIRITTYPPDPGATYEYCGLVTAKAAIGTGPIIEVISAWTDFFGLESGAYSEKLRQGEQSCMMKIQQQAIAHNANAIVGAHITYTELTRGQGMVLVCMTGTAIILENGAQNIRNSYEDLMAERAELIEK